MIHFALGRHMSVFAAAALMLPLAVAAQEVAVESTVAPSGDTPWLKICNSDPSSNKELCLVTQELRAETGQFIASATVRQITGEPKISFIAAVPPGMLIQPGLRAQIDKGKQHELKYGICFPNACYAELEINADFITELKGGGQVTITTLNQTGKAVAFPMSLVGFTKVYDGPGMDAQAATAKQDELNKALQERAKAAREKLIEQQQKEAAKTPQ
jgi:invasion protein IalB